MTGELKMTGEPKQPQPATTSTAFAVRPLQPPFSPALMTALVQVHQAGFDRPWSPESLRRTLEGPARSWGAFAPDDGLAPLGFLTCQWLDCEAEILTFAVAPSLRRKGVGAALVQTMLQSAKGEALGRIFLEVEETNHAACRLYQQAGFVSTGRRAGYYAGTDAVLMEYSL